MIDWLSLSLRWQVAYKVAASPNPQPYDDILYKSVGLTLFQGIIKSVQY